MINKEVSIYQQMSDKISLAFVCDQMDIVPHEGQAKVVDAFDSMKDEKNGFVIAAGRRWGKSFITTTIGVRELLIPNSNTILLTPVFNNAKILFNNIVKEVMKLGLPIKSKNMAQFSISLTNGSTLGAFTSNNIDAALGNRCSLILIDETQSIPNLGHTLNQFLMPMLLDFGVRGSGILHANVVMIGSPRGANTEFFGYYTKQDSDESNWISFNAPTSNNPIIPLAYLDDMRKELGEKLFRQEILAEWLGSDEGVFFAFDPKENLYDPEDLELTEDNIIIEGIDIGFRDSTTNVFIYRMPNGDYYVHEAYSESMRSTKEHVTNFKDIENSLEGEVETRYIDPAAAQTAKDFIEIYDYNVSRGKNKVIAGLACINQLFSKQGADGKPKLFINKHLTELIRQLVMVQYKEGAYKGNGDPFIKDVRGTHWDLVTALRYGVYSDQVSFIAGMVSVM